MQPKFSSLFSRDPQYCGPYTITKRINNQAYQLLLPPYLKVHNVFHVSLLKDYVPSPNHVLDDGQVLIPSQGYLELKPKHVLDTRERKLRNRSIFEHRAWQRGSSFQRRCSRQQLSTCCLPRLSNRHPTRQLRPAKYQLRTRRR